MKAKMEPIIGFPAHFTPGHQTTQRFYRPGFDRIGLHNCDRPGVRAFKFVQAEDLSIGLQLVAGPEFGAADERDMLARIGLRVGEDTPVASARVDAIAAEK